MKRHEFQSILKSFARMLSSNYNLQVKFYGSQAYHSKNLIVIPPLQLTEESLSTTKFYIAHECAHDLFTDIKATEEAIKTDKRLHHIYNILEDPRIEDLLLKKFSGLVELFKENIAKIFSEINFKKLPLSVQLTNSIINRARKLKKPKVAKHVQKIMREIEDLIDKGSSAADSFETLEWAKKIFDKIKDIFENNPLKLPESILNQFNNADFEYKTISARLKEEIESKLIDEELASEEKELIDDCISENETIETAEHGDLNEYLSELMPLQRHLHSLAESIKNIVEKKRLEKRSREFKLNERAGRINSKSLWKLTINENKVFKQKQVAIASKEHTDPDSVVFYLLGDMSGSMSHDSRSIYAKQSIMLFSETLASLGINFIITGYTANEKLKRIIFKRYEENYFEVRTRLNNFESLDNTFTAEHIPFAARDLEIRKERKKVLIIITDADGIENQERLDENIELAKSAGIELICVGIQTETIELFNCRKFVVNDLNEFPRLILEEVRSILKR